ncbi:hypothetical protein [Pseudomonas oryzihabitans]|uniref:Uncharacterized protein n=1 Tax=Pseudomonas oryzihabitans TaxID=47885 RepID=A0ABX3IQM5_9PSED|nr:hypothetical protein [Pseudomonas psychrotolerans]ONN70642.1 hypothetical protein BVL52_20620 [Pseudomonas psychrotolerans]
MAGFKIHRPNGSVAIDANYFNLALRQSGTHRMTFMEQNTVRRVVFTLATDQAIIAFRSPYPTFLLNARVGNGQTTFYWGSVSPEDHDLSWWLFDLPQYGQKFASGGKLIVRRPQDGQVAFDSRMKYLKVMDFYRPGNTAQEETRNYGRTPAVVQVNRAWAQIVQPMQQFQTREETLSSAVWTSGNSVKDKAAQLRYILRPWQQGENSINYGGGLPQTMVVDVQDY